jgi:hypothetical protein
MLSSNKWKQGGGLMPEHQKQARWFRVASLFSTCVLTIDGSPGAILPEFGQARQCSVHADKAITKQGNSA